MVLQRHTQGCLCFVIMTVFEVKQSQQADASDGRHSAGSLPRCEFCHFTTRQRRARSGDHCPFSEDSFYPEIHTTSSSNQSLFQPCPPISISIQPPKPRFVLHKHGSPASPKDSTPNHRSIRALHLAASGSQL